MFYLSITKKRIDIPFKSLRVTTMHRGPFVVTMATDNFFSAQQTGDTGLSVDEGASSTVHSLQNVAPDEIMIRDDRNALEISRSAVSGRPVYYHTNAEGEFFCSTHVRLLRQAGVKIQEAPDSLPEFFIYRFVMPPRTMYRDIWQLVAGSTLTVSLKNDTCQVSVEPFHWPESDGARVPLEEVSLRTLDMLTESIRGFCPDREGMTVLLSGGLDSSILYQLCRRLYGLDETYSAGFPFENPENNSEKAYALSAAEAMKASHRYFEFTTNEFLTGLIQGISAAEVPLHHLQSVLLYMLFDRIPREKKVVLSGLGADGIFGPRMNWYINRLNMPFMQLLLLPFRALPAGWRGSNRISRLLRTEDRLHRALDDPDNILWTLGAYGSRAWVRDYFGVRDQGIIGGRYETVKSLAGRSMYDIISLYTFLGSGSVSKAIWNKLGEDRGKAVYYPYCDENLLQYAYTVPWSVKLAHSKNVLRKAAEHISVPDFIINRPKQGFGITADKWGEKDGVFEALVPVCAKVFDIREIRRMQSAEPEKAMTFWNMLNYALWKRLCIDDEPVDDLVDELSNAPWSIVPEFTPDVLHPGVGGASCI